jgi:hypothetical protein
MYLFNVGELFFFTPTIDIYKIYRDDIKLLCENGAVIHCPGLFEGELLVLLAHSRKSIIIAMNASDPDTEYAVSAFHNLIQKDFSQCIPSICG